MIALSLVGVLFLAGGALAYWTGLASGSAAATAATALAVTLTPAAPATRLYPGGTSDVSLRITNPNPFTVRIASLALDSASGTAGYGVDAPHSGCALSTLIFTTQTTGWTVPARVGAADGSLDVSLAGALAMSGTAASACQGASFIVYLVAGLQ